MKRFLWKTGVILLLVLQWHELNTFGIDVQIRFANTGETFELKNIDEQKMTVERLKVILKEKTGIPVCEQMVAFTTKEKECTVVIEQVDSWYKEESTSFQEVMKKIGIKAQNLIKVELHHLGFHYDTRVMISLPDRKILHIPVFNGSFSGKRASFNFPQVTASLQSVKRENFQTLKRRLQQACLYDNVTPYHKEFLKDLEKVGTELPWYVMDLDNQPSAQQIDKDIKDLLKNERGSFQVPFEKSVVFFPSLASQWVIPLYAKHIGEFYSTRYTAKADLLVEIASLYYAAKHVPLNKAGLTEKQIFGRFLTKFEWNLKILKNIFLIRKLNYTKNLSVLDERALEAFKKKAEEEIENAKAEINIHPHLKKEFTAIFGKRMVKAEKDVQQIAHKPAISFFDQAATLCEFEVLKQAGITSSDKDLFKKAEKELFPEKKTPEPLRNEPQNDAPSVMKKASLATASMAILWALYHFRNKIRSRLGWYKKLPHDVTEMKIRIKMLKKLSKDTATFYAHVMKEFEGYNPLDIKMLLYNESLSS